MDTQTAPLHFTKETLIEVLDGRLQERQQVLAEEKAARDAALSASLDPIVELFKELPHFAAWVTERIRAHYSVSPADPGFLDYMRAHYGVPKSKAAEVDSEVRRIERLIRVYSKAADDQFEVQVTDEVFSLL